MRFQLLPIVLLPGFVAAAGFEWDCTKSLGTCNNACYAVNHGASSRLTYDANESNRNPRRTASGCNKTPCTNTSYKKFGGSCDEYPFASTKEGGANAFLRCVDATENSSEGGQLGNFYKTIKDGAKFDIFMRNYGGATFCQNSKAANDGGEFRLVSGNFKNARLRRDSKFVNATSPESSVQFREFLDENGGKLLSLNPELDAVGTMVYSTGGYIKIVDEVLA